MAKITKKFKAKGMHCQSCEELIKRSVTKIDGIKDVKVDYATESVEVTFDENKTNIKEISDEINKKGYECIFVDTNKNSENYSINKKFFGIVFAIIGILVIGYFIFRFVEGIPIPEISENMGYGLVLIVGLLTGFHCVSMCGGFVVSYTTKSAKEGKKAHISHFMYGLGKTISYTVIGAGFGLLGSIIIFTPMIRGVAGIIAGLFLIIFGLNSLNLFSWLRRVRIRTPMFMARFVRTESKKHNNPLVVGLLNGLMIACGPLQAMYIMAAGTGSMIEGAKILFIFGIGTLPVLLGFGFLTSFVSKKATHKILKVSGVVVIILGLIMFNRGLALTGTGWDTNSLIASFSSGEEIKGDVIAMQNGYQVINMEVNKYGWEPDKFILKKGVPVKWVINGKEINGCNNAIQVPKLGLKFDIKPGEQTIEFTPDTEGTITWSCWMGMIPGVFIVKDNIDLSDTAEVQKELATAPELKAGSCGGGGSGGCGCGGGR